MAHDAIRPADKIDVFQTTVLYSETPDLTRFKSENLEWGSPPGAAGVAMTQFLPAQNVAFVRLPATYRSDWRPAPRKQYVLVLDGLLEVEAGSGEKRTFRPGSIVLVSDTSGRGHRTNVLSDQGALLAFVPVP